MSAITPTQTQTPLSQSLSASNSKLTGCINSAIEATQTFGHMICSIPRNCYETALRIYDVLSNFFSSAYLTFLSVFNKNAALSYAASKGFNQYLKDEFLRNYHLYYYPTNHNPEDEDLFLDDRQKLHGTINNHLHGAIEKNNFEHADFVVNQINGPKDPSCNFKCHNHLLGLLLDKKAYPLIDKLFDKGTIQIYQSSGLREPLLKNLIMNKQDLLVHKFYEVFSKHDRDHKEKLQTFIRELLAEDEARVDWYKEMGILP